MNRRLRNEQYLLSMTSIGSLQFQRPQILTIVIIFIVLFTSNVNSQSSSSSNSQPTVHSTTTLALSEPSTLITTTITTRPSTLGSTTSTSPSKLVTAINTSPIPIPQPFDNAQLSGEAANFSSSTCPQFMSKFLADPSFKACVPFSLLLYTSAKFIQITHDVSLNPFQS